jgi:hypothetical protein
VHLYLISDVGTGTGIGIYGQDIGVDRYAVLGIAQGAKAVA